MLTQSVILRSRLSPAEIEDRLRQIIRARRTPSEFFTRRVPYRPAGVKFVGELSAGRFMLRRLREEIFNEPGSDSSCAAVRGHITPSPEGSEIRIAFTFAWDAVLIITPLIAALAGIIMANIGRFPLGVHLIFLAALSGVCGYGYVAFRMDCARCLSHFQKALGEGAADGAPSEHTTEPSGALPRFTWPGSLARLVLGLILVSAGGILVYGGFMILRAGISKGSFITSALIGVPVILLGLIFLMPLYDLVAMRSRIWMLIGRLGRVSPSDDPRRKHLD
ncbi:MAG: hypothetical protein A3A86_06545 [Elusimicrobia bacterium RIFCSPLOWO2_01_FULL_60_11]|nr:MAG: hypothetical protein A3A86_06545 [Elusimicrobia bacterium RIFCSPLOWO2_01_FULL_60_11]